MISTTFRPPQYPLKSNLEWENELYPNGNRLSADMVDHRLRRIFDSCYPILSQELVRELVSFVGRRTVLEVGAGSGYLARVLHDHGVSIRAIDHRNGPNTRTQWWERELFFNVEKQDALEMDEFPADIVLMTWPCMDTPFSFHVANKLQRGQIFLYQGEGRGGCTGVPEFFDLLADRRRFFPINIEAIEDSEFTQSTWYDHWSAYRAVGLKGKDNA